jgi:serine phosphatase RsbU (regulator of sigma subunit)
LDAEGLILGVRRNFSYEEKTTTLNPGDILLLYTDGITEAENQDGEFFGEDRLCSLLQEQIDMEPAAIIENILHQVRLFTGQQSFNDDVSMVVLKMNPPPGA